MGAVTMSLPPRYMKKRNVETAPRVPYSEVDFSSFGTTNDEDDAVERLEPDCDEKRPREKSPPGGVPVREAERDPEPERGERERRDDPQGKPGEPLIVPEPPGERRRPA